MSPEWKSEPKYNVEESVGANKQSYEQQRQKTQHTCDHENGITHTVQSYKDSRVDEYGQMELVTSLTFVEQKSMYCA